jgi:hypothetical protein
MYADRLLPFLEGANLGSHCSDREEHSGASISQPAV